MSECETIDPLGPRSVGGQWCLEFTSGGNWDEKQPL